MACSSGFPGSYNDKTIARYAHVTHHTLHVTHENTLRFDALIKEVGVNPMYTEYEYSLFGADGVATPTKGVYLICDGMCKLAACCSMLLLAPACRCVLQKDHVRASGGYHKWKQLICGMKHTSSIQATLWSVQMESVRKDIECCFGILKVRFRILSHPIQYHSKISRDAYVAKHNNVVWSCAILHNLLLAYDGERVIT